MRFFKFLFNFALVLALVLFFAKAIVYTLDFVIEHYRGENRIYQVARGVGSVPYARGKILVYSFLLKGKDSHDFSKREKLLLKKKHNRAFGWISEQAKKYNIKDLKIDVKIRDYTKFKLFHKMHIPIWEPGDRSRDNSYKWLSSISHLKGYGSVREFYQKVKGNKYQGICALMFFRPNFEVKYSYALRSFYDEKYNNVLRPEWAVIHFYNNPLVIAHEFLHLPGADDLYDKKIPKKFCYFDIFNHIHYIDSVYVCKLTAFAIGWIDKLPYHDGLKIEDHSSPEDIRRR